MNIPFFNITSLSLLLLLLSSSLLVLHLGRNNINNQMPHLLSSPSNLKVAILGAAGGIGQSLSLLLKTQLHYLIQANSPTNIHLSLYDINKEVIDGLYADLSHIDTPISLSAHAANDGKGGIHAALVDSDIIVIPAGMPRKPGMTRDDLFNINAKIISQLTDSIAESCDLSKVFILLISNPVNSLVPVVCNRLISHHKIDKGIEKRLLGITNLDLVRASTFLNELSPSNNGRMPYVPVIGGHSGDTIVPVFSSQSQLISTMDEPQLKHLISRVQYGGDEIVKAKNGKGSATLSMAHAACKIVTNFTNLLLGNVNSFESINYIPLLDHQNQPICKGSNELMSMIDNLQFFAIPATVTSSGVNEINYDILNHLNSYEKNELIPICLMKLKKNINSGLEFNVEEV
ncbi:hypothetical protein KAFR_0C01710 [Kazachstania africana CBS 2517]|uniref:malate dehydrogenase n=1 Tax=Kazachstania africana (strain ATCC 22294 / BCRC 22015 / CBS 2517 / CECT 1963 / NBRC 1671 / NRRL Y-8276) TaxID=1071382 RepID=H2AS14_KAZAF|nr:hypothetical protein KAFR_0C01710 [Kazachstania africana CBS 2517]CCF57164.1 hypothetical protein KAFR_0C01710 [Kazachstania africana CBS 2517]